MPMADKTAREAQKLSTDRLVKLYTIDATAIGGAVFRFSSSFDARIPIVSIEFSGTTATVTSENVHAMATGELVRVSNAEQPEYNGDWEVTVIDPNTFTYEMNDEPSDDASGINLYVMRLDGVVKFDGENYVPVAIEVTGFEWNGQGTAPTPTLLISNTNRVMMASVISLQNLNNAKFIRTRTFRKHLDDGEDPDPLQGMRREVYRINRKVSQNKLAIEFQLGSALDQEGVKIPGRQCLRNTCTKRYRVWDPVTETFDYTRATCPYVGGTYFKRDNSVTYAASEDSCSKQLVGCSLRFGNAPLPTTALPGIGGR